MRMLPISLLAVVSLIGAAPALAQHHEPAHAAQPGTRQLGTTTFPNSGAAAAQRPFIDGVLWLHSFEYDQARDAFREAQRRDPGFALAYWGEAMTHNHPVWFAQDAEAAGAALARLAPTPELRRARAPTERERLYLDAVETLFGPGDEAARDTAYAEVMRALHEAHPDDENAAAFYALALLGTSHGGRDTRTYMRAAAVVEEVFARNPQHPGAAHYLIHSYDDPVHAPLGLRAARAYSAIAPDAAHAQHMTTHIFVALGMWDLVVSQNEIASGPDPQRWLPGHYTEWLLYGYLQQGRQRLALEHLEAMWARTEQTPRRVSALMSMRAAYVVDAEAWDSPLLERPLAVSGNPYAITSNDLFVRGFSALRRGGRAAAERSLAELTAEAERLRAEPRANHPTGPVTDILRLGLAALLRLDGGDGEGAVALLTEASAIMDVLPFEYGPPPAVKPPHELLGEVLLALDRPAEAQRAFQRALELTPRRVLALRGLHLAATAAGDTRVAAHSLEELRAILHAADPPWATRLGAAR